MPNGFTGRVLRVDLSTRSWSVELVDEVFMRQYMGGEGFIAYTLLREVPKGVDPLSPENVLIFSTGVYTGSPIAGSGRHSVGAKSPLTGGFGEAEAGGFWGPELKKAGYDAIVIKGAAESPVFLCIKDDDVQIMDAAHLWGKSTADVEEQIRNDLGDPRIRVGQIGIAGERLSRIACVMFDRNRAAGRTGMGAVMGSKKLRAIAVRGTKSLSFFSKDAVLEKSKWLGTHVDELMGGFKKHGTSAAVMHQQLSNTLPTKNFSKGQFEGAEKIDGTTMTDTLLIRRDTCFSCPVQCKRVVSSDGDIKIDPRYGGPEFETLGAFGSMCEVDDLAAVCKANEICNACGMDTISAGVTIAFAMECVEKGILMPEDLGGINLHFGDSQAMLKVLEMMVRREGGGELLADGAFRAAEKIGHNSLQFVMHVKKQEIAEQEPRAMHGHGLGIAVSPTGADHMHNIYDMGYSIQDSPSIKEMNTFGILEAISVYDLNHKKVKLYMYVANWQHLKNCIGMCMFIPFDFDQTCDVIKAITGWNISLFELQQVAQRVLTIARLFNIREGVGGEYDCIPDRFSENLHSPDVEHRGISKDEMRSAVSLFYGMMGWSPDKGIPMKPKLLELDLEWTLEMVEGM